MMRLSDYPTLSRLSRQRGELLALRANGIVSCSIRADHISMDLHAAVPGALTAVVDAELARQIGAIEDELAAIGVEID